MSEDDLHCTTHISHGPDTQYEKPWFKEGCLNDRLSITTLFWSKRKCAALVNLTPKQSEFFSVPHIVPHVSLSKNSRDRWQNLGSFMKKCVNLTDWTPTAEEGAFVHTEQEKRFQRLYTHTDQYSWYQMTNFPHHIYF